jgi:pimeloyl-ACP methyl ester carboxylesterase
MFTGPSRWDRVGMTLTRLRTGLRAGLALLLGVPIAFYGALHVVTLFKNGFSVHDALGALPLPLGLTLLALAIALPWRHRGEGSWKSRLVAVPAVLVGGFLVFAPTCMAIFETHKWRGDVGQAPSTAYRDVTFKASDDVKLSGWYRPTANGATVIVVHGGGSDRRGSVAHASLLARHGYGVLLYDARGRGRSEGRQNAWGWGWKNDIEGAIAFLKARPEVDPERVGALGLSSGGDAVIQVAGTSRDLKAVVADGAVASSYDDIHEVHGVNLATPLWLINFATVRVASGTTPGPTLIDMMPRVREPMLLVAAGAPEKAASEAYDRAAGAGPVERWYLPKVTHTDAIRAVAPEYERRVTEFFDRALAG